MCVSTVRSSPKNSYPHTSDKSWFLDRAIFLFLIKKLSKSYGSKRALENVDLQLGSGRILGLLGPNGSGKTTLIKLAEGLLQPTEGEILIDGEKPGAASKAKIAYLPDREYLPDYMTIEQLLKFYGDFSLLCSPCSFPLYLSRSNTAISEALSSSSNT